MASRRRADLNTTLVEATRHIDRQVAEMIRAVQRQMVEFKLWRSEIQGMKELNMVKQGKQARRFGSVQTAAEELGVTPGRVRQLCSEGAIAGAFKTGLRDWISPLPVERARDRRIKKAGKGKAK